MQEITPVEAIAAFAINDRTIEAASIAHEENIVEWAECLVEVMSLWGRPSYGFNQLVSLSHLSPGRVFLALFLEERFKLNRSSDFYGEIVVSI